MVLVALTLALNLNIGNGSIVQFINQQLLIRSL
ncbi:hypothetical protein M2419_002848 [Sphingobacterium sp. BIGb0116]|nr:hypothetical protein [Sphingobacterium sp. BIGb0116]